MSINNNTKVKSHKFLLLSDLLSMSDSGPSATSVSASQTQHRQYQKGDRVWVVDKTECFRKMTVNAVKGSEIHVFNEEDYSKSTVNVADVFPVRPLSLNSL